MALAIVVPAIVTIATIPVAIASGIVQTVQSEGRKMLHDAPSAPQEPIPPSFLPLLPSGPNIDLDEFIPSIESPSNKVAQQIVLIPEDILRSIPRPMEFIQSIRSTNSPAEVLRDVEGPLEILMSFPGPHREIPNPIADIYWARESLLWLVWDGRTLFGSGFDNFIRSDIPLMRDTMIQSLTEARQTSGSLRDTNVQLRRKMLPIVQKQARTRLPKTINRTNRAVDKSGDMMESLADFLDKGIIGGLLPF